MKKQDFGSFAVLFLIIISLIMFIPVLHFPTYVPLLFSCLIVSLYGITVLKIEPQLILKSVFKAILKSPILLLILIGTLTASWIISGTVPFIVNLGVKIIKPKFFLPMVLLICTLLSAVTGSSWTTCGTFGIAFIGMARSMGIPEPMTLGAILCGAFFGDKLSPLSDFAVSTSQIAQTTVSKHIKSMLCSSIPSIIVSLILFWILGRQSNLSGFDISSINEISSSLSTYFNLNYWCLLPLFVLIIALVLKLPGLLPIILSIVSSALAAIFVQKLSLSDTLLSLLRGARIETSNSLIISMCNRGGALSLYNSILIVIFSFATSSALKCTNVLSVIAQPLKKIVKGKTSLYIGTFIVGSLMALITGSGSIGAVISYNVFKDFYDKFNLDHSIFSRTVCELITIQQPLVFWGSSGAFVASCFEISPVLYAPYYFTGYLLPLFGFLISLLP